MAFPKKLLNEREEIVLDLRPHWLFFFEPLLSAAVALVLMVVVAAVFSGGVQTFLLWVLLIGFVVLAVWGLWRALNWSSTYFAITTDRVIYRSGVFAKRGIQIPLERVNNVLFHQNILERMLGAGDLIIESAGESGRQVFSDVKHPDQVQNVLYREMDSSEQRSYQLMADHMQRAGGPAPAAAPDVTEQLQRLEGMLQRGTLTQEEFDAQKRKLLGT